MRYTLPLPSPHPPKGEGIIGILIIVTKIILIGKGKGASGTYHITKVWNLGLLFGGGSKIIFIIFPENYLVCTPVFCNSYFNLTFNFANTEL